VAWTDSFLFLSGIVCRVEEIDPPRTRSMDLENCLLFSSVAIHRNARGDYESVALLIRLGPRWIEFVSNREVQCPRNDGYTLKRWMRVDTKFQVLRKLQAESKWFGCF